MKQVLITGGTGFIGSHTVRRLDQLGYHVTCLIRNLPKAECMFPSSVSFVEADLTSSDLSSMLEGLSFDCIVHCAALIKGSDQKKFTDLNVKATRALLEFAFQNKIKHFIHLSSIAVFLDNPVNPFHDNLPYCSRKLYGKTKIEAEKLALEYQAKGLPMTILRPSIVYGEGEPHFQKLLLSLYRKGLLPLFYGGKNKLHLTNVRILADVIVSILEGKIYLDKPTTIADKRAFQIKEIYEVMGELTERKTTWNLPNFLVPLFQCLPIAGSFFRKLSNGFQLDVTRLKEAGFEFPEDQKEKLRMALQSSLSE